MPNADRYRTGDQSLVRQINLSVILHSLRENGPMSRAGLAEMTGLNKTTVSSLIRELINQGFVHELGLSAPGSGRPAVLVRLNPAAGCMIASEIGVDFLSVVRTDFAAEVVWRHRESIGPNTSQPAVIDRLLALLRQAQLSGNRDCRVLGIALGVPGLVDLESGTLLFAPNLGWQNAPMRQLLSDAFDAPVFVDNEANMGALGEQYFGAAQSHSEVLFVSAGVGLGGGIVRGGQLARGAAGFAGEFGHMTLDRGGDLCKCGNHGCWETYVSQAALFRYIQENASRGMPCSLGAARGSNPSGLTLPQVAGAARDGDLAVMEALRRLGSDFGIGIASLVNALNPELVVIGGILSVVGEFLLPAVQAEVRQRALRWNAGTTEVVLARHGSDACVMGGVATVLQSVLAQPGTGPVLRGALFPTLMPARLAGQQAGARRAGSQPNFAMASAARPGA